MPRLCLCVNQVARLRKYNKSREPDPVDVAIAAEVAGIDGIVAQLREDRSDITDRDVHILKEVVKTHFNLAVPLKEELVKKTIKVLPDMVTLMPPVSDDAAAGSSLDVVSNYEYVEDSAAALRANNVVVSVFIDPDSQQIRAAAKAEVDYVQLNTTPIAGFEDLNSMSDYIERLRATAIAANKLGLGISMGGGLNYQNLREFGDLSFVEEINVGRAILSRAVLVGIGQAIGQMKALVRNGGNGV